MQSRILALSKKLISIPSSKENLLKLADILNVAKKELKDFTVETFDSNNTLSLLVYNSKTRPGKFKIILNAHLDVVPGKEYQYKPYEKDGKLFGRGAYDMKAAAAVEILVFKEVANKVSYALGLQLVTDEEIGGFNGTKYQISKGVKADFVIAGENTDLTIINRAKGIVWAKISSLGKTAHGAYPWFGDNAVIRIVNIVNKINKDFPVPDKEAWKTTINISAINTQNKTYNKIPDRTEVLLDIRYISEDKKKIIDYLNEFKIDKTKVEVVTNEPEHYTDQNNKYILSLKKTITKSLNIDPKILPHHGGSDIRHYNVVGCDGIEFGPIGAGHHTDNEWVDIKSLEDYYNILKNFLLSI